MIGLSKLYEIAKELRDAMDAMVADEETGEILDFAALDELINSDKEFDSKIEGMALYAQEEEVDAEALKAKAKELQKRANRKEKRAESIKKYMREQMEFVQKKKIETSLVSVRLSYRTVVDIFDQDSIPVQYLNIKETKSPDKKLIKKAIDSGMEIPGARLVDNPSMQIK